MISLFDLLEAKKPEIRQEGKSALENGFPFAEISVIAEAESWRKEIYRPLYHLHKWWAQRLGSVFRAIILASALPENASILDFFYSKNDLGGLVVFDPFMGSGTTIGEAVKLGCTAIGRDINPVAYNSVRAAFAQVNVKDVQDTFKQLEQTIGQQISTLYRLQDNSQVLYYFWVKQVACPECASLTDLFNNYIFSRHAYPSRQPEAQCLCPACGYIFKTRFDSIRETCPSCLHNFNPQVGTTRKAKATCSDCGSEFIIAQAVRATAAPPIHRMYAKMVLCPDGTKQYCQITDEDVFAYTAAETLLQKEPPLIAPIPIEPGYNTNQVINYSYTSWDQFFNARQLLALTWLGRAIQGIQDSELRLVFSVLFSGTLEFNNMFCTFKGEGTGAVRHMFSHHILKPERQPLEANVWGTPRSSGSFSTLFKSRLLRALEYRAAPFEVEVIRKGSDFKVGKRYDCNTSISNHIHHAKRANDIRPYSIYLSSGDSSKTDLSDRSVDLIITDPPFFDNVHYSELADFFYAWQWPLLSEATNGGPTTRNPHEVQDTNADRFSAKLAAVFRECHRVLKDDGILAFTYHHSREEGWMSIAHAVAASGFCFVSAQPVKAEMSVAAPKSQAKEPIDLDIILVCRKKETDHRVRFSHEAAVELATRHAVGQIASFKEHSRQLSQNDVRIIKFAHLLVELSAGRTEAELLSAFQYYSSINT